MFRPLKVSKNTDRVAGLFLQSSYGTDPLGLFALGSV